MFVGIVSFMIQRPTMNVGSPQLSPCKRKIDPTFVGYFDPEKVQDYLNQIPRPILERLQMRSSKSLNLDPGVPGD